MRRAVIFSNGVYDDYDYYKNHIKDDDFVICADGAIYHCLKIGVIPDVWIGDFDSCVYDDVLDMNPDLHKCCKVKLNPVKDETDTHIACLEAIKKGIKKIVIWGAFGKRIDHMLANISLLELMHNKNIDATLEDCKNRIFIVSDYFEITKEKKYLSIIPLDAYAKVSETTGLIYPLKNDTLYREQSRGISNEISGSGATIKIDEGSVIVIESDD